MINQFHGVAVVSPFRSLREGAMELAFANYGIRSELAVTVLVLYGLVQSVIGLFGGPLQLTDQ